MFNNIVEATGIRPVVIITDSDPAVDAAIRQVFTFTYPIHCAFHISHNLDKNLRKLLANDYQSFIHSFYSCRNCITESIFQQRFEKLIEDYPKAKNYLEHLYKMKSYWAHCYTKYQFTGGMIASSRVESVNACLKRLLNNSNTPLYDLMIEIQRLLNYQDKEKEYEFWCLSIPHIRNQNDMNFLFSKIDQCLQEFLMPTILKMHRNEMNQSLYYVANQLIQDVDVHEINC
ncbi:unnamed protein product [Rhizophagus irregularis]|uniref:MULE transposase domain-containing protein n=1 Tax=Rhizophagus irregularis TaxID=588596 RepID=A0A916EJQ4_9GLOM|nr:unnamed protein product [Rhizophagus irregularis]